MATDTAGVAQALLQEPIEVPHTELRVPRSLEDSLSVASVRGGARASSTASSPGRSGATSPGIQIERVGGDVTPTHRRKQTRSHLRTPSATLPAVSPDQLKVLAVSPPASRAGRSNRGSRAGSRLTTPGTKRVVVGGSRSRVASRQQATDDAHRSAAPSAYKPVTAQDIPTMALVAELVESLAVDMSIAAMDVSRDGSVLCICCGRACYVWSTVTRSNRTFHLMAQLNKHGTSFHKGAIAFARFTPDNRVVTFGYDQRMVLWSTRTRKPLHTVQRAHKAPVVDATFDPEGTQLFTACADGTVTVWNVGKKRLQRAKSPLSIREHVALRSVEYILVEFGSEHKPYHRLCCAMADGSAGVWDIDAGVKLGQIDADARWKASRGPASKAGWLDVQRYHTGPLLCARLSPDTLFLVTAGADHTCKVWNVISLRLDNATIRSHQRAHSELKTAQRDELVSLDERTSKEDRPLDEGFHGTLLHTLRLEAPCTHIAFTTDSRFVVTSSQDAAVRVWSLETGKQVYQVNLPEPPHDVWIKECPSPFPERVPLGRLYAAVGTRVVVLDFWAHNDMVVADEFESQYIPLDDVPRSSLMSRQSGAPPPRIIVEAALDASTQHITADPTALTAEDIRKGIVRNVMGETELMELVAALNEREVHRAKEEEQAFMESQLERLRVLEDEAIKRLEHSNMSDTHSRAGSARSTQRSKSPSHSAKPSVIVEPPQPPRRPTPARLINKKQLKMNMKVFGYTAVDVFRLLADTFPDPYQPVLYALSSAEHSTREMIYSSLLKEDIAEVLAKVQSSYQQLQQKGQPTTTEQESAKNMQLTALGNAVEDPTTSAPSSERALVPVSPTGSASVSVTSVDQLPEQQQPPSGALELMSALMHVQDDVVASPHSPDSRVNASPVPATKGAAGPTQPAKEPVPTFLTTGLGDDDDKQVPPLASPRSWAAMTSGLYTSGVPPPNDQAATWRPGASYYHEEDEVGGLNVSVGASSSGAPAAAATTRTFRGKNRRRQRRRRRKQTTGRRAMDSLDALLGGSRHVGHAIHEVNAQRERQHRENLRAPAHVPEALRRQGYHSAIVPDAPRQPPNNGPRAKQARRRRVRTGKAILVGLTPPPYQPSLTKKQVLEAATVVEKRKREMQVTRVQLKAYNSRNRPVMPVQLGVRSRPLAMSVTPRAGTPNPAEFLRLGSTVQLPDWITHSTSQEFIERVDHDEEVDKRRASVWSQRFDPHTKPMELRQVLSSLQAIVNPAAHRARTSLTASEQQAQDQHPQQPPQPHKQPDPTPLEQEHDLTPHPPSQRRLSGPTATRRKASLAKRRSPKRKGNDEKGTGLDKPTPAQQGGNEHAKGAKHSPEHIHGIDIVFPSQHMPSGTGGSQVAITQSFIMKPSAGLMAPPKTVGVAKPVVTTHLAKSIS